MTIYIGADHGGFHLKDEVKSFLKDQGYEIVDVGAGEFNKDDDFPDYGGEVGRRVSEDPRTRRGILLCRSGVGMDIVANKFKGVRAVLGMSEAHVVRSRHDEDTNVLAVASDFTTEPVIMDMIKAFLSTPFATEEKYSRRLGKIEEIEKNH